MPQPASRVALPLLFGLAVAGWLPPASAQEKADKPPEFPPHAQVLSEFEKVISLTPDDDKPLWTLFKREKDQQLYAELPANFASQKYFIALTVASGDTYAGLQGRDLYVYWRKYDKRLALIQPNVEIACVATTAIRSRRWISGCSAAASKLHVPVTIVTSSAATISCG